MPTREIPRPAYRDELPGLVTVAHQLREGLQHALDPLCLHLEGGKVQAPISADWTPLPGIPARMRVLAALHQLGVGAFISEVEYELGASLDTVTVAEAVAGFVLEGVFFLRRHEVDPDYHRHAARSAFFLEHDQQHQWRTEGRVRSLLIFLPPPIPRHDCDDTP